MNTSNIITIVVVGLLALALVIFLIWKNQKDRKLLNPDADDSIQETMTDQQRQNDKM